jgi:hypothetical protein
MLACPAIEQGSQRCGLRASGGELALANEDQDEVPLDREVRDGLRHHGATPRYNAR